MFKKKNVDPNEMVLNYAAKILEDERKENLAFKNCDYKSVYSTSLTKGVEPYCFVNGSLVWNEEILGKEKTLYFAKQVYEINRLRNNFAEVMKIYESPKVCDYTKDTLIKPYLTLMKNQFKVYQKGLDDSQFDMEVSVYNDSISRYMVVVWGPKGIHKSFRVVNPRDNNFTKFAYDYIQSYKLVKTKELNAKTEKRLSGAEKTKEEKII